MPPDLTTLLWGPLAALLIGLGWVLVRRIRQAKHLLPRGRLRIFFSLRSPSSSSPPDKPRRFRVDMVEQLDDNGDPPLELDQAEAEWDERDNDARKRQ
jgi:hypothetical protein